MSRFFLLLSLCPVYPRRTCKFCVGILAKLAFCWYFGKASFAKMPEGAVRAKLAMSQQQLQNVL